MAGAVKEPTKAEARTAARLAREATTLERVARELRVYAEHDGWEDVATLSDEQIGSIIGYAETLLTAAARMRSDEGMLARLGFASAEARWLRTELRQIEAIVTDALA